MRDDYADWLAAQGYNENTCNTQTGHIRQIEKYYGPLDEKLRGDGLDQLITEFTYTKEDERRGRPNPSKVEFNGRNYTRLQSLKGALRRYARFLDSGIPFGNETETDLPRPAPHLQVEHDQKRFVLERDMQTALRRDIGALDPKLSIIDDGSEHAVASGFIDILCEDQTGATVVVELKSGKTDARVIGQILGYMGDLIAEGDSDPVRGIIVAHSFDARTLSASRAIPNLTLVTYSITFTFDVLA